MPMPKLHFFNPGSEEAIWSGNINITPTANVQRMFTDLSCLPLWYADVDDYVWTENELANSFVEEIRMMFPKMPQVFSVKKMRKPEEYPLLQASPWGLSPHSLYQYKLLYKKTHLPLIIPSWKERYRTLTGRRIARCVLSRLKELLPGVIMPKLPTFVCFLSDIEYVVRGSRYPLILKKPYSSSGRGLHWIKSPRLNDKDIKWINGALNKQGELSIERELDKFVDFAMEFESDGQGNVSYKGLSVFGTQERGRYVGNIIGSDTFRESLLLQYVKKEELDMFKESLTVALSEYYGRYYKGSLGVDMMIYATPTGQTMIHPCVEINMRETMGTLALSLSNKYICPDATGNFRLEYDKNDGAIMQKHQEMEANYPLTLRNGRITSGYMPLCPITKDTSYWAYIIVSQQH